MIDRSIWERWISLQEADAPSLLGQLIELFLATAPNSIEDIKSAQSKDYAKGVAFHAHALKSSAASLGANTMRDLCLQIETLARDNNLSSTKALATQLEAEYASVAEELNQELAKIQRP